MRWSAVALAGALAIAAAAVAVPGAAGGFGAALSGASTATTATYFTCGGAAAADAGSAIFQWSLADTGTTAVDSSGKAVNGVYVGTHTVETAPGTCSRDGNRTWVLDGTTSYARSPQMPAFSTTAFTIEARVRVATGSTAGGDILSACGTVSVTCGQRDDRLYLTADGRVVFATYSSKSSFQIVAGATAITDGAWHHVAGTLSSAGMKLYLDGKDVTGTATAYSGSTAAFRPGADPRTFTGTRGVQPYWHVGAADGDNWPLWAGTYLPGRVGWAAVYSTALSAAAIRAHWSAGR